HGGSLLRRRLKFHFIWFRLGQVAPYRSDPSLALLRDPALRHEVIERPLERIGARPTLFGGDNRHVNTQRCISPIQRGAALQALEREMTPRGVVVVSLERLSMHDLGEAIEQARVLSEHFEPAFWTQVVEPPLHRLVSAVRRKR